MKDLHQLYQERYAGDMRFRTSPKGLHSAIVAALGSELRGKRVLDIGCGAGRLSLYCAAQGAHVTGVDFSQEAVALATVVRDALVAPPSGLEFLVDRFEDVTDTYDIVLMSEVFEHIEQPPQVTLRALRRMVRPGGTVVICMSPSFVNFRGIMWMTLQQLFDFLMSPSDVHFVFPWDMDCWCAAESMRIDRRVGLFFDWGWGQWAADDMALRIGYALRDKRKEDPRWEAIEVHLERTREYVLQQGRFFEEILQRHVAPLVQEVSGDLHGAAMRLRDNVVGTPMGDEIAGYLGDARVRYADQPPLNMLGATQLYFCTAQ